MPTEPTWTVSHPQSGHLGMKLPSSATSVLLVFGDGVSHVVRLAFLNSELFREPWLAFLVADLRVFPVPVGGDDECVGDDFELAFVQFHFRSLNLARSASDSSRTRFAWHSDRAQRPCLSRWNVERQNLQRTL